MCAISNNSLDDDGDDDDDDGDFSLGNTSAVQRKKMGGTLGR